MEYFDDDDTIFDNTNTNISFQTGNATEKGGGGENEEEQQQQHQKDGQAIPCFCVDDEDLSDYDMYIDDYDYSTIQQNPEPNTKTKEEATPTETTSIDDQTPEQDTPPKPKFQLKKAMDGWNAIKARALKAREEEEKEAAAIEEARQRAQPEEFLQGAYYDAGSAPKPYLLECVLGGKGSCEIKESIRLANEIWLTPARLDYGVPDDFMPREWVVGMRVRKVCEGTQVEFKQGRTSVLQRVMNDIERYGNAFVNTRGGVLIYGVTDDGIVEGVRLNRHDRDFLNNGLGERISTLTPRIPPECYRLMFVPTKLPSTSHNNIINQWMTAAAANEEYDEEEEEEEEDSLLLSDKESYVIIFVMGYHKTLSSRYILFKNNIAVALQRANSSTQFVSIRMISYAPSSRSAVPGSKEYSEVQGEEAEALGRTLTEEEEHATLVAKRRAVLAFRETLAAYRARDQIGAAVSENRVTIIAGPTGCGKSTQVPQIISDAYDQLRPVKILVVQPRRISAVALARRVAEEMGVNIGEEVGYHIGGRPQCDDSTRILFITYGMFKQYLDNRDLISPFSHIVLDEIHERKLDMDVCLAMALSYASKRPRTRLVVMSATIDVGDFARYCGGFARMQNTLTGTHKELDLSREYVYSGSPWLASTVRLTGRKFPIQTFYLDDVLPREGLRIVEKNFSVDRPCFNEVMKRTIIAIIEAIASKILAGPGAAQARLAVLVFLPGISAIGNVYDSLSFSPIGHVLSICTMHSTCSIDEQRMLLRAPEPGRVKVVLCTNIAESSLTVPDAAAIIDTCLCRDVTWDKTARSLTLRDNWISRESAMQRTGRCGRVQPGEVYRLVPRAFFEHALPAKCIPEIRRVPLEESILRTIRGPFKNVEEVLSRCIEPPDAEDVRAALQNLVDLGLVERRPDPDTLGKTIIAEPTPLGRITAELPVPWQMGMFLVLAKSFGLLDEAIVIAAAVATGSPFKRIPILPALEHEARVRFSGGFRCDLVARFNAYCYWAAEREKLNLGGFTGVSMAANTAGSSAENIAAAEFRWCEMNVLDLRQLREIDNLVFALRGKLSAFGLCPQPRKSEVAKRVFYRRELIQNEHLGIAAQDPLGDSAGRSRRGDGVSQLASYMAYAQEWQEQEFDEDEDEEKENEKEEERGCAKVSTRKDFDKVVFDRKKELMKTPGQTNVVLERIEFALRLPSSSFIETHSTEEIIEMKKQYITLTEDDYNNLQGIESYEAGLDSGCNGNVCEDEEKEKEEEEKSEKTTKKKETKKKQKSKKEKLKEEGNSNNNNNNEEEEGENIWKQLSLNVKDSQDKVLVLQTLLAAVYPQNVFKVSTKAVVKPVWDMWVNVPDRWDPCSVVELNGAKFWNSPTSFYFRNFTTNGLHATETFEDHDSTSREPPFFVHMDKDSVRPFAGKTAIESQKLIPESAFSEGVVRMLKIWNKNFDMTYLNGGGWNRHTEQSQNNNNNSNNTESPSSYASVAALKSAYAQQQRLEQERQQQQQQQQRYHLKSFQAFGQTFYTPLVNAGNKEVDVDAGTYQDDDGDGGDNSTNGSQTSYVRLYINPSMSAGAHFVYQSGSLPLYVSGASLAHPLSPPPLSEELLELVRLKAAPRRGCLFRAPRRIGVSPDIFYQQSERTGRIVCSAHSVSMFPDDALSITEVIPLVFLRNVSYKKGHLSATYLGCSISQYASIPREYLNSVEKLRRWIEVSFQELFRDAAYWPLKHSVGDDTSLKFTRDEARLYGTAYRSEKAARKALLKLIRSNVIVLSALNSEDYEAMKAYATAAATNTYKGKGSRTRLVAGTSAMELASSSISSSLSRNKAEYFTKLSLEPKDNDSDYDSDYVDDC